MKVAGRSFSMTTGERCLNCHVYVPEPVGANPFDSHFGHDKSIALRQYSSLPDSERPTMFYAGDGVSDLSAAKETDLLFAKKGHGKSIARC